MSIVPPETLYHRVHGPNPPERTPVVFLHGLMGFAANWGKIWPKFEGDRSCLVLDQRGHGRSAKPAAGYDPSDYAGDLAALLDRLGWKRVHLVGHSMGGRVALRFCSLNANRAASLVMEDSGVESRPERTDWIRDLLSSVPTPFGDRETAKHFFEANFRTDPMTGSFLFSNLETQDGALRWRFHAPGMVETVEKGRATNAMKEFCLLHLPTLLVRGGRSAEFPADEAERMRDCRKGVELVTIAGAGHFVHAEKPEEFTTSLREFLNSVDSLDSTVRR